MSDKKGSSSIFGLIFGKKKSGQDSRMDNGGETSTSLQDTAVLTVPAASPSFYEGVVEYVKEDPRGNFAFIGKFRPLKGSKPIDSDASISFTCVKPFWSEPYKPQLGMAVFFSNVIEMMPKKDDSIKKKRCRAMRVWPKPASL